MARKPRLVEYEILVGWTLFGYRGPRRYLFAPDEKAPERVAELLRGFFA